MMPTIIAITSQYLKLLKPSTNIFNVGLNQLANLSLIWPLRWLLAAMRLFVLIQAFARANMIMGPALFTSSASRCFLVPQFPGPPKIPR